ncbi:MAG: hypothetical protein RJB38_69 [Pseudomonadota bacterium]
MSSREELNPSSREELNPSSRDYLLSPLAIRQRSRALFDLAAQGGTHFQLHPENLSQVAKLVIDITRKNYPTLAIPFHSRWGHFRAGGLDRLKNLRNELSRFDPLERVRTLWDLVIPSVLLDAGAGDRWRFLEPNGTSVTRSEGLGVASLALFESGALSNEPKMPHRAQAQALQRFSSTTLEQTFQVSPANPLIGCEGRAQLLRRLGQAVFEDAEHFPHAGPDRGEARVGFLADFLVQRFGRVIPAPAILRAVLDALGPIWPGRIQWQGKPLGDVWSHPALGPEGSFESLVPFHKLSQWLTYSLIEPLQDSGFEVTEISSLTGLAEYRNGGLILDGGLVSLRDPSLASRAHRPDSPLIIEWRALTLAWLEQIAIEVRTQLQLDEQNLPLAKILEGGTWWAGRALAREKRPETAAPPLELLSDGTVF